MLLLTRLHDFLTVYSRSLITICILFTTLHHFKITLPEETQRSQTQMLDTSVGLLTSIFFLFIPHQPGKQLPPRIQQLISLNTDFLDDHQIFMEQNTSDKAFIFPLLTRTLSCYESYLGYNESREVCF